MIAEYISFVLGFGCGCAFTLVSFKVIMELTKDCEHENTFLTRDGKHYQCYACGKLIRRRKHEEKKHKEEI